jgi:hypothetical protein
LPQKKSAAPLVVAALVGVAALAAAAAYVAKHPAGGDPSVRTQARDAEAAHEFEDGATRTAAVATVQLRSIGAVPIPFALRGEDARVFVRHLTLGPARPGRMVGTCAGGSVRLFNTQNGLPVTETSAPIACEGYDLSLIGDIDGDGNDDVAAINASKSAVLVLSTQGASARTLQTVSLPGALGLAPAIIELQGRALVVAVAEQRAGEASELVAIDVRSGAIVWRARGRDRVSRVGHPTDLGLAIGLDADGDGVRDVVAGASPPVSVTPDRQPESPRCVELFSGASGRLLWARPFCQRRGGVQSVSLGPDVDGDQRADVAVSTDVTRGSDPRVVLVSGATGAILRRFNAPDGPAAQGFGWPVSLGPDVNGDGAPELAVGSVSASSTHVTLLSSRDGSVLATRPIEGEAGFPNLRLSMEVGGWRGAEGAALFVAAPNEGLKVFSFARE